MKDNFDDILKRKLEEQHFPVDDTHRQEMIELLNGKKRRGILPLWWLGSLVIVASLAGYFFIAEQEGLQPDNPIQKDEIRKATPVTEAQQTPSIASAPLSQNATLKNDEEGTSITAPQPINPSTVNSSTVNKSTINSSTVNPSTINPESTFNSSTINSSTVNSSTVNPESTVNPKSPGSAIASGKEESEPSEATNAPTTYLVEGEILTSHTIVSQAAAVTIEDPDAYLQSEPEATMENENSLLILPQERLTRHTAFVEPLEVSGVEYTSNTGMNKIMPQTAFRKSMYLFGEAGVGMVLQSLPSYTSGWKFRAGAGIGFNASPKIQFSLSAGYLLQVGGFDFERTSTINQPSFGTRSSYNSLTPDKLHFLYSRVGMQYRLHRHLFGVHGGMQYLYGAQGTIVTQVQDQFAAGTSESSSYGWVKTDGLRQLHWTADISYGYQITPRLVATAGTDFYFSSITVSDAALASDGYYWDGAFSSLHPFITLNYLLYGR
jgi:hypothetical protein